MELTNISFAPSLEEPGIITVGGIPLHMEELAKKGEPVSHGEVLTWIKKQIVPIDFRGICGLPADQKLKHRHYQIIVVEQVLALARSNRWGLCRRHDFIYLYNGSFWRLVEEEELQAFLGEAAELMGVDAYDAARHVLFREQLVKQFLSAAFLPKPEQPEGVVLANLQNGTFEISPLGTRLRPFEPADFLTYQLPFAYDPEAQAPLFRAYLDRVLPEKDRQTVLAEYLGYVFVHPSTLKLEKTLLLYGSGANGKSVFFEVVNALLGADNVSSYSLQSLTNEHGYHRAKLANKLVNYASEINGKLEASIFKQLVSGEPVEARLPYGAPFILTHYAKLIFNVNELPKEVEQTHAFFRRFLIIPFDVTIPEAEQDRELPQKIISKELSGVFNWVLEGLSRILAQKRFSDCEAARQASERYRKESDSVAMFMEDENNVASLTETVPLKEIYKQYQVYCGDSGYRSCSSRTFSERLRKARFTIDRQKHGMRVWVEKQFVS
jgi:putative DNA primase/helicase